MNKDIWDEVGNWEWLLPGIRYMKG